MIGNGVDEEKDGLNTVRGWFRSRSASLVVLLLILAPLVSLKLLFTPGPGNFGSDAAYYYQIARNVSEGRGLVTSVSLYHQGLDPLPQRSPSIYPVWPVLLGMTGRLIGLQLAAALLPKLLYILDLVLLFLLARAVEMSIGNQTGSTLLSPAHLIVGLFGANLMFFSSTSHPYTEGLAFLFAFSALLALDRAERKGSTTWSLIAGGLAGFAFLTRTQMIALIAGIGLAALVRAVADRSVGRCVATLLLPATAVVAWYLLILRAPVQRAEVPYFEMWVETESALGWFRERFLGFWVSFSPFSALSYVRLFGPSAYLPPVAAILWTARTTRGNHSLVDLRNPLFLATAFSGLAFYGSLNLFHEQFFLPWLFGWRHGLPYVFLILPAVVYLFSSIHPRWIRWGTVLIVVISVALGIRSITAFVGEPQLRAPSAAEEELFTWLEEHHEGTPTVLTTHAQSLSVFTSANFHWATCEDSPERTREMLRSLPIDFVIIYRRELRCPFQERTALRDLLEPAAVFGEGEIYLLRPRDGPLS